MENPNAKAAFDAYAENVTLHRSGDALVAIHKNPAGGDAELVGAYYLWNHDDGGIQTLLDYSESRFAVSRQTKYLNSDIAHNEFFDGMDIENVYIDEHDKDSDVDAQERLEQRVIGDLQISIAGEILIPIDRR